MPKGSDNLSSFIKWQFKLKSFSLLLELKSFILTLSIEVLEDFIVTLLLNSYVYDKTQKVSSLLFELKDFILTLSMDMLKSFFLALLLKTIGIKRENSQARLSYNLYLATLKVVWPRTVGIEKKLNCLAEPMYLEVSALI